MASEGEGAADVLVAPPPDGGVSGGNLYNAGLVAGLREVGAPVRIVDVAAAEAALGSGEAARYWVDSLFLDALPRLGAANTAGRPLALMAHYLPTLVKEGRVPALDALSDTETAAIAAVDGFLAPSRFMAEALRALGAGSRRIAVVEPGLDLGGLAGDAPRRRRSRDHMLRAVAVANLVPGKGLLPLLDALIARLAPTDRLVLDVVGRDDVAPEYARACRERARRHRLLAAAVRFVGPLARADMLGRVAASDLFVSASRMESFGMALAEARALGVPIAARRGGNAAAHVAAEAGGRLVDDADAVAGEILALARNPSERERRRRLAAARAPAPRSWRSAARAFLAAAQAR